MDLLAVMVTALAFAGSEAAKTVVSEPVKDAYRSVKQFLSGKYPQVDLTPVERAPQSTSHQEVLIEDLTNSGAAADAEFSRLAKRLIDAVAVDMEGARGETGIRLREFQAASLQINDVIASGAGIIAENTKIAGYANIAGVRAGFGGDRYPKNS